MNPIKDGWKTSEFWVHMLVQGAGFLSMLNVITASDAAALVDGGSKSLQAIFTLITQATAAILYMRGRNALKAQTPTVGVYDYRQRGSGSSSGSGRGSSSVSSGTASLAPALAVLALLVSSTAYGQSSSLTRPPIITAVSTHPAYLLPWRAWVHGQLGNQPQQQAPAQPIIINPPQQSAPVQPGTDPALLMMLQAQLNVQMQILGALQGMNHSAPAPTPAPAPKDIGPITYHFQIAPPAPGAQPLQTLPIQGAPLQSFPIQGAPLQQFPIQGAPLQQFPIQGAPLQQMPIQGAPLQTLPVAPQQAPQALPITPKQAAPQQLPVGPPAPLPVMPNASEYRRFSNFTHALAKPVN